MSGPKYSYAIIREQQRLKQLQRKLEEELEKQKCQQLISEIGVLKNKIKNEKESVDLSEIKRILSIASDECINIPTKDNAYRKVDELEKYFSIEPDLSGNSNSLVLQKNKLEQTLVKIKNLKGMIKEDGKELKAVIKDKIQEDRLSEFTSINWSDTGRIISTERSDVQAVFYEYMDLISESSYYDEYKATAESIIIDSSIDAEYKIKQIKLRIDAYKIAKEKESSNIEMLGLLNELIALRTSNGNEAKELPQNIDDIKIEIEKERKAKQRELETDYITHSVVAAFEKLGYKIDEATSFDLINGVRKGFIDYGDRSLVNVAVSNTGQMLFEVVGEGKKDETSDDDIQRITSEMRRFCPDYDKVKEILENDYGIILEKEKRCEPDQKYARVVDLGEEHASRRVNKEKKMMHYDD